MDFLVEGGFFLVVGLKKVLLQHFFFFVEVCIALARTQGLIKKKKILTHLNLLKVGSQSQRANEEKAEKKEEGIS